jgi:hypothetical protein
MNELQDYSKVYPDMPFEIYLFFSQTEVKDGRMVHKDVWQFCDYFHKKYRITMELPLRNTVLKEQKKLEFRVFQKGNCKLQNLKFMKTA